MNINEFYVNIFKKADLRILKSTLPIYYVYRMKREFIAYNSRLIFDFVSIHNAKSDVLINVT